MPSPAPSMAPVHVWGVRNETFLRDVIGGGHDADLERHVSFFFFFPGGRRPPTPA
jgi:hypothetical protein